METGRVVHHAHPNSVLWEKQVYLDRVRSLYDSLTRRYNTTGDPDEFIRRLSLKGIVADLLSAEDSPISTLMPYRRSNWVLQEESDGRFKSIVAVDPPTFEGERCFLVQGTVDYDTLSGHLTGVSPVSCSERLGTRTKVLLSKERRVGGNVDHYTNGSDGECRGVAYLIGCTSMFLRFAKYTYMCMHVCVCCDYIRLHITGCE